MPEWDENGNPVQEWDEQGNPAKPQSPFSALRGSKIEAQPSLLSRIGSQVKGFAQELPMTGVRGFRLLEDIASGNAAMNTKLSPADQAKQILASEKRYNERKRIDEMLNAAKPGEEEQRLGRIGARMVPGAIAAVGTGGGSLAGQAAIQGGVQAAQTLSEGASPGTAAWSGFLGAAGPGMGEVVNSGITRFVKQPFKKAADSNVLSALSRVNEAAAKTGGEAIDLPASAITNSPLAQSLERMGSSMIGGGRISERGVGALKGISAKTGQIGADADPMLAGQMTAADYGAEKASLQGVKNAKYEAMGNLTEIPAGGEQTLAQIDSWLSQGTLAPDIQSKLRALRVEIAAKMPEATEDFGKYAGDPKMEALIRAQSGGGAAPTPVPRSVADLTSQKAGIRYGGPNASGEEAIDNRLRGLLSEDIDAALEPVGKVEQLAAAKAANANYEGLKESALGKTVGAFAPGKQFDKIPSAFFRTDASATDLRRLMDVTSPETQTRLREVLLQKIVGNAENITPKAIKGRLYDYRNAAKAVLTPEQIRTLRDISTLTEAMGKTKVGSPTAPLLEARKYIEIPAKALMRALTAGGSVAAAFSGPAGLGAMAGELAGETALARFLGSAKGQKWLTTGLPAATRPGKAVRATGLAGSRFLAENDRDRRQKELDALLAGR